MEKIGVWYGAYGKNDKREYENLDVPTKNLYEKF